MKLVLLLTASVALLGVGVAVGMSLEGSRSEPDPPVPSEGEVVFRNSYGETRVLTPAEAAGRIEQLERDVALARRRTRAEPAEEDDATLSAPAAGDPPGPRLFRPDGRTYSQSELIELARTSPDPSLRTAAVRELRRADTDVARTALREILADEETPPAVREEAAKALAQQPNRDKLPPEDLIAALRDEKDPAVRRALAQGVGRMSEREAWMSDIAGLVHDEKDPDVRRELLQAVLRDVRDPMARAELVGIAGNVSASIDERRAALAALRGRTEPETLAVAESLLSDRDPRLRENAVAIMGASRTISAAAIAAAFADDDPGVRRAAFDTAAQRLPQFANDKAFPKADYQALVATATKLATSDPDPLVRRAAVQQAGNLPRDVRETVLAAGREDPDLFVKITSYARSPEPVARSGTPVFVSGLDSADVNVRDFAYRQLQRVSGVTAPYDARWNAKARAEAIGRIRQDLAASGR